MIGVLVYGDLEYARTDAVAGAAEDVDAPVERHDHVAEVASGSTLSHRFSTVFQYPTMMR